MAPRRSTVLQAYNMKVLVIGGSGLQGAPTVRHLLAAGHAVTVLSRGSNSGAGTGGRRPVLAAGACRAALKAALWQEKAYEMGPMKS